MKLNLKQKKILNLLSINCRFSNKDIGKSVGLSKDAVAYQVKKLIAEQKLARFNTTFFYPSLSYQTHHIWIKLKNRNQSLTKLKKIKQINSINSSFGKFDLQILILTKTKKELKETLFKLKNSLDLKEIKMSKWTGFYKRFTNIIPNIAINTKIPKNKKNISYELNEPVYSESKNEKITLDKKDKLIIKELIKNPRSSFQEISKKTNLNHETIRYRIKTFVKKRFITNFGLLHNFQKYSLYTNYFLIKTKKINEKEFKNFISQNKNIFYCAKLEGEYNLIVYLACENPVELGQNFESLMNFFGSSLEKIDLLFLEKIHKYVQFPERELEE